MHLATINYTHRFQFVYKWQCKASSRSHIHRNPNYSVRNNRLQIPEIEYISGCTVPQEIRVPQRNRDKAILIVILQWFKLVDIGTEILHFCHAQLIDAEKQPDLS